MAKLVDITGKAVSGEWGTDDNDGNGIPVLRTTNFTNEGIVDYSNVVTRRIVKKNIQEKFLQHGDILIEKSGGSDKQPVGRVVFFEEEGNKYLFNNFTGRLRIVNPEKWVPKYVFYGLFFNHLKGGTRAYENRTTGLHNLQLDSYLMSVSIPDTPVQEQRKVVDILDTLKKIITRQHQQIKSLDELTKARFVEMFGDPENNPMAYEKKSLKNTCRVITGNTPSRAVQEYYGDFIEWIKTDNIVPGVINPTKATEYLSEKGMSAGRTVGKNVILMACIAGSITSIGKVCVTDRMVAFNQQINAIVSNNYNVLFLYVLLQLSKDYLVEDINMSLKGILSKSKLEEKKFIVPPLELQQKFASFVAQVEKSKIATEKSLKELEILQASLMQKYFG